MPSREELAAERNKLSTPKLIGAYLRIEGADFVARSRQVPHILRHALFIEGREPFLQSRIDRIERTHHRSREIFAKLGMSAHASQVLVHLAGDAELLEAREELAELATK